MVETFYVHLEFPNKKGNWSVNLAFLCSRCGVCCTLDDFLTAGPINASVQDQPEIHSKMQTISDELGKIWEKNEAEYDRYIQKTPCPFLANKSCSIYPIRPNGCRQFPKTLFGMSTKDCVALNRFKKMQAALKKGKTVKETYHNLKSDEHVTAQFTEKQLQTCIAKLRRAGITEDELELFISINH